MTSTNPHGVPLLHIGRDVHGRFRPGNPGGPGNPFARKVAALRKALLDSVSEQDLKDILEMLKLKARQGDTAAIKLLLQYCVGKPAPAKDPDRLDIDEWQRLRQMRVGLQQFWKTVENIPACLACHLAATSWPCEVQEGPLAETVQLIHSQLQASGQAAAVPRNPRKNTTPDSPQPHAAPVQPSAAAANQTTESKAPSEATVPTAPTRPSSAKGERKSNERREPAGPSRRDRHSPTDSPSPNGGNEQEQLQAREQRQRLGPPCQPSGQTQCKPPRR
jgi:hypothetical protein